MAVYWWDVDNLYPTGKYPARADVWKQIWVSTKAIPLYTALPAIAEAMVERVSGEVQSMVLATFTGARAPLATRARVPRRPLPQREPAVVQLQNG